MSLSKHISTSCINLLTAQCQEDLDKLVQLLKLDIRHIQYDSKELKRFVSDLRRARESFDIACHNLICASYKISCFDQGNRFKEIKVDMKHETNETIALVIGHLEDLGDSLSSDSFPNYDYSSNHSSHELRTRSCVSSHNIVLTPKLNVGRRNATNLNDLSFDLESKLSFPRHSLNPFLNPPNDPQKEFSKPLHTDEMKNSNLTQHNLLEHDYLLSQQTQTKVGRERLSNYGICSAKRREPPNDFWDSPYNNPDALPKVSQPNIHTYPNQRNCFDTPQNENSDCARFENTRYDHSTNIFTKHPNRHGDTLRLNDRPFNSVSPTNPFNVDYSHAVQTPTMDSASLHMIKQQLFQKAPNPYDGKPHMFNSWFNGLTNKMLGLNLTDWDRILVLAANTTSEPLVIVEKHMAIGGPNPSATLAKLVKELRSQFGSNVRIANALSLQVESFPRIKSCHETDKMKDLLYLCQYIEANMSEADELTVYNTAYGARKIWLKLPESLQNSWRAICDDHRTAHEDRYPSFARFVSFLAKKTREFDDPLLKPQSATDSKAWNAARTTLKTNSEENSTQDTRMDFCEPAVTPNPNKNDSSCPIHENSRHSLDNCRQFKRLGREEKFAVLREKKLCFLCLGPHMRSNCNSNVKCDTCGNKHVSSMHHENVFDPARENTNSNFCTEFCGKNGPKNCSKTLLVDLSMEGSSRTPLRCYAIIDEQSSSSFADPLVAKYFGVSSPISSYSLKTLAGLETSTEGVPLEGLQVKGVSERRLIKLPPLLTNPFIPDSKSEIATPETVAAHPHLRHLSRHFAGLDDDASVALLIGRDSDEGMFTRCFGNKAPFAHHTALGWALVEKCCSGAAQEESKRVFRTSIQEHFSKSLNHKTEKNGNFQTWTFSQSVQMTSYPECRRKMNNFCAN